MPHTSAGLGLLLTFLVPGARAQETPKPDERPLGATLHILDRHCVENGPRTEPADLAWCMLALLANGSTLRVGDHRNGLKIATYWLRDMQDEQGHFTHAGVRCDLDAQILATVAMTSTYSLSRYKLMKPNAIKAAKAVLDDLGEQCTIEQAALLSWLLEELRVAGTAEPTTLEAIETTIRATVATYRAGTSRRGDAAFQVAQLLLGERPDPDLVVAKTWPGDLFADPLHTVFAVLAVQHTGVTAKKQQQEQWSVLQGLLTQRVRNGDARGTWPAKAPFDNTTTTAIWAFALGVAAQPAK